LFFIDQRIFRWNGWNIFEDSKGEKTMTPRVKRIFLCLCLLGIVLLAAEFFSAICIRGQILLMIE